MEKGRLIGIIRMFDFIKKIMWPEIEANNRALKLVINNIHEASCVVDKEGTVESWSKKSEMLYGVSLEKIVGKRLEMFFPNVLLLKVLDEKNCGKYIS